MVHCNTLNKFPDIVLLLSPLLAKDARHNAEIKCIMMDYSYTQIFVCKTNSLLNYEIIEIILLFYTYYHGLKK